MSERITVLLPSYEQREDFLWESVRSVLDQTSPNWKLLVGLDPRSPAWMREWLEEIEDRRLGLSEAGPGFARALNALLEEAQTPFVSILLSDDRYAPRAIETLLRYRRKYPEADFFHSTRRYIDSRGQIVGPLMPSRESFRVEDFKRWGSPVKHLMCWRREMALLLGGMDESLSPHGCDDFDFPWRMAEAGARFQAVKECLYEYRVHDEGPRLTTATPLQTQLETLELMFRKHGATRQEECAYVQHAVDTYLPTSFVGQLSREPDPALRVHRSREANAEMWSTFAEKGFARRHFFPHKVYIVPRSGPDGAKLAQRMCGVFDPGALRVAVLFTLPPAATRVPAELHFDDELVWHGQQLGLPGQVASANLVHRDGELFVTVLLSDLVQRISRRREHKTRVEGVFKGWAHLLLNAVLEYALDAGLASVFVPTSVFVLRHTDRERTPQPPLFERVYDGTVAALADVQRAGDWWRVDLRSNEHRVVPLARRVSLHQRQRTICVAHDIERGLGHRDVDPAFAADADRRAPDALREMLDVERALGVRATYCIVGSLLEEVRASVEEGGHALGFHSYEHVLPWEPTAWHRLRSRILRRWEDPFQAATEGPDFRELVRCREVDYRLRGYRPPQSRIGPGLHDRHLAFFGFEWLASSSWSLGIGRPILENGIVKIPIQLDDFDLHRGELAFAEWERRLLEAAEARDFIAFGLHDCYGDHWLPGYRALLEKLGRLGTFRTFDEIADDVALANSLWC